MINIDELRVTYEMPFREFLNDMSYIIDKDKDSIWWVKNNNWYARQDIENNSCVLNQIIDISLIGSQYIIIDCLYKISHFKNVIIVNPFGFTQTVLTTSFQKQFKKISS